MNHDRPLVAIILAAGLGTRMRSARAKVLHEAGGEPMAARSLRAFAALRPQLIVTVVGHQAAQVEAAVHRALPNEPGLRFAIQSVQRGTGDAARIAMTQIPRAFDGDIIIGYGDTPRLNPVTLAAFIEAHRQGGSGLSIISANLSNPGSYGRVIRDAAGSFIGITEYRDASPAERAITEINTGVYLVDADLLRQALAALTDDNEQHEFYLTDIAAIARRLGARVNAWLAGQPAEFDGINTREELARMNTELRDTYIRTLMDSGV
ncbi:MAG: NTP transferase domain-containing protein, partial [Candidatus Binataceae bacterium]